MEHGKHVIVEKPITANVQELKELIEIAKEKQLFIFEADEYPLFTSISGFKTMFNKNRTA
ncbi:Gfo/Idh/MocA family oxidoreductase [Coprobacillaceae bacterium CR2/5/TPMF4]|nr:Gfo/Idh/MocA family oxidoreductase [Coprobacillaceae bacterium CR2/5/TPMF4]